MFIKQSNNPSAKLINIKNVSNIGIEREKMRIIFNFQHSINIFNGGLRPDYIYMDFKTLDDFYHELRNVTEKCKDDFFIDKNYNNRYVNKSAICSINIETKRRRIIFNLNHQISAKNPDKITSNFIFWNFDCESSFNDAKKDIESNIF